LYGCLTLILLEEETRGFAIPTVIKKPKALQFLLPIKRMPYGKNMDPAIHVAYKILPKVKKQDQAISPTHLEPTK
jgi:hypothetical protein